jgi:hypothetical protein
MGRRIETGSSSTEYLAQAGETNAVFVAGPLTRDVPERGLPVVVVTPPDGYIDRLLKYVPAEIIALYLGVTNVIPPPFHSHRRSLWVVSVISALCVPFYMWMSTREPARKPLRSQIVISSVAFPLWVFAIGGPFAQYGWYENYRWVAAVIITFTTFLFGLYLPPPPRPTGSSDHLPG